MTHLDYIADADSILLWFPSQNRTFSVPKPYVFGSETVRFWDGERILYLSTIHWLIACLTNCRTKSKQFLYVIVFVNIIITNRLGFHQVVRVGIVVCLRSKLRFKIYSGEICITLFLNVCSAKNLANQFPVGFHQIFRIDRREIDLCGLQAFVP